MVVIFEAEANTGGEVDDPRHRKPSPLRSDRRNQQLGLSQRQTTDPVDLLGHHDFTRLKIGNNAQKLRPIISGARRFLR